MTGRPKSCARRVDEALVVEEGLDAVDALLVAVGVGLAEVVRARGEHLQRLVPAEAAAGLDEVPHRVVARRQALADAGEGRLLGVHAVGAEALAQTHHRLGLCG